MNDKQTLTIEHNGVTITYDEKRNLFCFTLRDRDRTAESLAKAREMIDKPVKEKKDTFTRFKAWRRDGSTWGEPTYVEVEVTSIAEACFEEATYVWIKSPGTHAQRKKICTDNVFPRNEKNDAIIAEWKERQGRVNALKDEQAATAKKLKYYEIPAE